VTMSEGFTWRAQVDQTGDVIEFYNAVFIPATKAFLLQLGNGSTPLLPLPTLTMPGTPLRMGASPYSLATPPPPDRAAINKCLSPAGKVFVSPMRTPGQQVTLLSPWLIYAMCSFCAGNTVPAALARGTLLSCHCGAILPHEQIYDTHKELLESGCR
jgi:hypothetical protein